MEAIVSVGIRAGEPFVEQDRQSQLIRQIGGVGQRVIRLDAPVHLRPIENVLAVRFHGGGVKLANAVKHCIEDARSTMPLHFTYAARTVAFRPRRE